MLAVVLSFAASAGAFDLTQVPRTIVQEPAYQSQPRYCLLVFGPEAKTRVWLVHDGDTLYADLNGDRDLTDPDERLRPSEASSAEDGTLAFEVGEIPEGDLVHKSLLVGVGTNVQRVAQSVPQIAAIVAKKPVKRLYMVSAEVEMPGRRGTGIGGRVHQAVLAFDANGVLQFADTPGEAPIIHFGGDWEITLFGQTQLTIARQKDVFLALGSPGLGPGTTAYLAYENLVPAALYPKLEVTFPTADSSEKTEQYVLTQRCCTYNFHGGVRIPDDVSPGEATVTITFDDWLGGFVAPTTHRVPLVAPKVELTLQPVSPRLKASLMHPTRDGILHGVGYSPDGKRIIAGEYPGGIIQVWDAGTGDQLKTIDTASDRHRTNVYFHLSPDWSSIYVALPKRKFTRVEREGKKLMRWEFDGNVSEWDLASGELLRRLQHTPPRNVTMMILSPDGRHFLTGDEISGEYESQAPRSVSLWNAETGTSRDIGNVTAYGVFSPDSSLVAVADITEDYLCKNVVLVDTATGEEALTFPIGEESAQVTLLGFSPDGKVLVGRVEIYLDRDDRSKRQCSLRFWDADSGEVIASIPANAGEFFSWPAVFSPDGRTLAATNWYGEYPELYLINLARKEISQAVALADEKAHARTPAFSPDGRWMAVITQVFPENVHERTTAEDLPQPRIHLVEAATGKVVETIIAPQGIATSLDFSPDGRTLATCGNGRVVLWDLSTPPGQLASAAR